MNKYSYLLVYNECGTIKDETIFTKKLAVRRYIELVDVHPWDQNFGSISDLRIYRDYYKRNGDLVREDYTQKLNKFLE
jgi:hypothetical protein